MTGGDKEVLYTLGIGVSFGILLFAFSMFVFFLITVFTWWYNKYKEN